MIARDYMASEAPEDWAKYSQELIESDGPIMYYQLAEKAQEPGQDLAGALKMFHEKHNIMTQINELMRYDPQGFNTMCHGDMWFNNIMFKYKKIFIWTITTSTNLCYLPLACRYKSDGHTPSACTLIDLAIGSWNNPACDLSDFFFMSTTPMMRRTHETEFLGFYHDELVRNLHKLGEDPSVYPYRYVGLI
jgi:thiamine kinase-like enzyme